MSLLPVLGLLLSSWILWLLVWEAAVPAEARRLRLQRGLQLQVGFWLYLAGASLSLAAMFGLRSLNPGQIVLGAALVAAIGSVLVGGARTWGRNQPFPRRWTWFLAPVRGLALWTLLAYEAVDARLHKPAENRTSNNGAEPTSPDSLLESARDLDDLTLEEVMVPRSQVVALAGDLTPREALPRIRHYRHSHYPVFDEDVDKILGMVRMVDLSRPDALDRPIRELAQTAPLFPETLPGVAVLEQLADSKMHSGLVVDEFGSHAGLVTMEDLVEVLIGDLAGEHDIVRKRIRRLSAGVYMVDGVCKVEEFNEFEDIAELGENFLPEGEYETVAGLFLEKAGRIPQVGDEVALTKSMLEVEKATDRRILSLRVTVPQLAPTTADAELATR